MWYGDSSNRSVHYCWRDCWKWLCYHSLFGGCRDEAKHITDIFFLHTVLFTLFSFLFFQVLSRKEIVHHGYENVEVKGADGVVEGEVMFKVLVHPKMSPKMEFLAYCVPPSETVLAVSRTFQIEKCLENKVCSLSS